MNVLVAEDNKNEMTAISIGLRRFGHGVKMVENGLQALEMLKNFFFDLVISDYKMPQLDGLDLIKKIQKNYPALPVLLISACDFGEIRKKFKNNGKIYFLAKPFDMTQLKEAILKIFPP